MDLWRRLRDSGNRRSRSPLSEPYGQPCLRISWGQYRDAPNNLECEVPSRGAVGLDSRQRPTGNGGSGWTNRSSVKDKQARAHKDRVMKLGVRDSGDGVGPPLDWINSGQSSLCLLEVHDPHTGPESTA